MHNVTLNLISKSKLSLNLDPNLILNLNVIPILIIDLKSNIDSLHTKRCMWYIIDPAAAHTTYSGGGPCHAVSQSDAMGTCPTGRCRGTILAGSVLLGGAASRSILPTHLVTTILYSVWYIMYNM